MAKPFSDEHQARDHLKATAIKLQRKLGESGGARCGGLDVLWLSGGFYPY